MLRINPDKVCYLIIKAREFDVKVAPQDNYRGSNPADDGAMEILEDYQDDPTFEELKGFLSSLNEEEMEDVLTLTWLGRGDYSKEDWDSVAAEARAARDQKAPDYLVGIPLLSDYLEEGLSLMGFSCEDFEMGHL